MNLKRIALVALASSLLMSPLDSTAVEPTPPGGFGAVTQITPEIQSAADFAVRTQAKAEALKLTLVKITQVESQVVAGMNYRLTLELTSSGQPRTAKAVVYRTLEGQHQLTSWEWLTQK